MGNPSASVAAVEALGARLQALLSAAENAGSAQHEGHAVGVLTPEDRAFWDATTPESTQDIGVFVATLDVSVDAAVSRVQGIVSVALEDRDAVSGSGVLRVAVASFHGLKIAKRWDVLQQVSLGLVDVVFEGIQQRLVGDVADVLLELVDFYASILLGFQHSSALLVRAQPQLEQLSPRMATLGHETLTRRFLVAATALLHCHRAFESECAAIYKALVASFGSELAHRPIAECEKALRDAAWIVPPASLNRYLATVEGKWVQDEFSSEQHASAATAPANAGSITLKKAATVVAHELRATIQDTRKKTQLQLDGALFRPLYDDAGVGSNWRLEGHWCQLLGGADDGKTTPTSPWTDSATVLPWTCGTCTLSNEVTATKCATCGAAAPANTTTQVTTGGAKASNPAPFQAVYDAQRTFMRVRWSRGEQSGVWLARKDDASLKFDLGQSVRDATSIAMADSNVIPSFAYSPRGDASRVVLLEKTYALSTYGEIAYELWIQAEATSTDLTKRTILSAGEFELSLDPSTGFLVWNVGSGMHNLTTTASVVDGKFHHIALLIGRQHLQIMVDGVVAGHADRGLADQSAIPSRRSTWLSIGGAVSEDGQQMDSCFNGVILDLRVWSDLNARTLFSPVDALSGSESGLIGYFPFVGDSHRMLVDASKHDNHATVFGSVLASAAVNQPISALICPSAPIEGLPVAKNFSSSMPEFEISGSVAYSPSDSATLRMEHSSAIWHKASVSIEHGFRSLVALEKTELLPTHASRVVVAMCEASYWDAMPLIDEAASLGLPYDAELHAHRYAGSALFVAFERVSSGVASVAVYVWKNRRPLQLCRLTNLPLGSDPIVGLAITYSRSKHVLSIDVMGTGVSADVAVDIEAALGVETGRVRTGVIVTSPLLQSSEAPSNPAYSSLLTAWTFESLEQSEPKLSAFHSIYPVLDQSSSAESATAGSNEAGESVSGPTVACTRSTSDGSAIEQATYGCQTCGVVHGAGLCRVCAVACHGGHELVYMGSMITACACAMRAVGQCKCATPISAADYPTVGRSLPKVAQWYCNRCTVVNSVHARECTICSNTAPDNATLGVATTVDSAPESTSRALVPVAPAAPAPSEWSCPACTYLNNADAAKCVICDTDAPAAEPKPPKDGLLTLYQAAESHNTPVVTAVATPAVTSWYCSACTMENKAADSSCFMCQTQRVVPIADPVDSGDVSVELAAPAPEAIPVTTPMETDTPDPPLSLPATSSPGMDNAAQLTQFQLQCAASSSQAGALSVATESWDSTAGTVTVLINPSAFVGQYVEGEYTEKDGFLRGLARLTAEHQQRWKFDGRFKKLSQSQENAVSLTWDRDMSRFTGKWFRGDGSGEWKCVASPLVHDFRGLAPVDHSKPSSDLQPFYSGMINMKQNLTNVCYQNSFLQSLFLTQAFRQLILSSKVGDHVLLPLEATAGSQGDVLKAVQDLFARLVVSQRPEVDSHALQRCLPSTFQAGRQQDTSDFAHFLIDSLSQQLGQHEGTAHGIDDVFGGTQATILACKTCGKKSVNREYFWELLVNMIDLRYTPITGISAVTGVSSEIATPTGYERLNNDLNKDRNGAPYVYLCVKRKPETSGRASVDSFNELPITDLVVKVVGFADAKPVLEGYERVELDLNVGGSTVVIGGKKQVYLFFRRELNGSPITDLQIVYGNESIPDGFKQIRVDLNQGDATKVFLCYRCDMPITDMKIVNSGIPGYRMVDYVLNRSNDDAVKQYLAFQVGGSEPCITDLQLVPASEEDGYLEQGWESLGSPSSTYENGVPPDVLVIRRGHGNPIFAVDVFRAPRQVPRYNDYEVINLYGANDAAVAAVSGSVGTLLKGDWLADEGVDRSRKSVRIHSVSEPIPEALVIKGSCDDKGEVSAIATATASAWSTGDASSAASKRVLRVSGYWKNSKVKQAQLFEVELRPGVIGDSGSNVYTLSGTIGDGKGRPVAVMGTQTSQTVRIKWPISQLFVLRGDERVPEGVEVVRETCSGKTGNLLAQTQSPHTLYLAVKREETPSENYIGDVCVIYGEIDAVPENYTHVEVTPSGHSANLNDGTSGVPIFLCYRRVTADTEKCLMDLALMWTSGAQADTLPAGFTKLQHTPLGMEANLNQGTTGVSIHLCFAKSDPRDVIKPVEDPLNGEYEIMVAPTPGGPIASPQPLIGKFIRLSVAERTEQAVTLEGKFGTVLHGYLPGMVRGTMYTSAQHKKRVITGVWMSDEQNASSMIDFVPPSYPFEWTLNEAGNEVDGWWCGADEVGAAASSSSSTTAVSSASTSSSSTAAAPANSWKLSKDAYVRVAFKKDYGTEWKHGQLVSSERVWRHDVESMLSRFVASRTLGGDNLLSCSQCDRKTESRTNTVILAPPAHLILTLKRMFYDWAQQKTRKCLHDVTFPALLSLPSLTSEDEAAVYGDEEKAEGDDDGKPPRVRQHGFRQYGLYGVLVHSGLTANSGHYFSYCRESDDSTKQLHLEDSPLAPWIKFNDSKVQRSSWAEINRAVSSSVSDAVYLLLYKRLSYVVDAPQEPTTTKTVATPTFEETAAMEVEHTDNEDEDEAMLLAKAMALSMSAAKKAEEQEAQAKADEETKSEEVKMEEEKMEESESDDKLTPPLALPVRPVDRAVFQEVEAANTQYLLDTMRTAASAVHALDLNTIVGLRYGLHANND